MELTEVSLACFRLGDDMYAVDIMRIREIIRPQKLAHLPKSPMFVEGVINLRGTVIPVIDLRRRFDLPPREDSESSRLLIVSIARRSVALVVDEVTEIVSVPVKELKPPPPVSRGIDAEYLIGVCLVQETMVMLLNIDTIFNLAEAQALQRMVE